MVAKTIGIDHDFGGTNKILNLPAATNPSDPVTLGQVNALIEDKAWKDNVRLASTANVNLSAPGTAMDGFNFALNDRFLAKNQTTTTENGLYVWNGASVPATRTTDANTFDELESATVPVDEGAANGGTTFRQTQVNGVIGTNAILFQPAFSNAAQASESTAGVIQIATQAEVDAGVDNSKAVTPAKAAAYAGRVRKFNAVIGDGTNLVYNVDHNFGTRNVQVGMIRNGGNYDDVEYLVTRPTVNRVTITSNTALASSSVIVTVTG